MTPRNPPRLSSTTLAIISLILVLGWGMVLLLRSDTFWMYVNLIVQAWLGKPAVAPAG